MMGVTNHKLDGVKFVRTNNMGGEIEPKFIVLHFTSGWSFDGDVATLSQDGTKVSAHLVIGRDGELTQIVPFNRKAWHAGPSKSHGYTDLNAHSIGIEVSNIGYVKVRSDGLYEDEYGNVINPDGHFAHFNRVTKTPPSTWKRHYHPRLDKGEYAWEPFYKPQYDRLDAIIPALLKQYLSIKWIVTHEEIDTRGWKTDINGSGEFDINRYLVMTGQAKAMTPKDAPVVVTPTQLAQPTPQAGPKPQKRFTTFGIPWLWLK